MYVIWNRFFGDIVKCKMLCDGEVIEIEMIFKVLVYLVLVYIEGKLLLYLIVVGFVFIFVCNFYLEYEVF